MLAGSVLSVAEKVSLWKSSLQLMTVAKRNHLEANVPWHLKAAVFGEVLWDLVRWRELLCAFHLRGS